MNTPVTPEGLKMLNNELDDLVDSQRPAIIKAIAEARAHGDLKENAEYQYAKEKQSFIEGRIKELESKLRSVQVIDVKSLNAGQKVVFGSTIKLENNQYKKTLNFRIVGVDEASGSEEKISYLSPIAVAALGKNKSDIIQVQTPKELVEYTIIDVIN